MQDCTQVPTLSQPGAAGARAKLLALCHSMQQTLCHLSLHDVTKAAQKSATAFCERIMPSCWKHQGNVSCVKFKLQVVWTAVLLYQALQKFT